MIKKLFVLVFFLVFTGYRADRKQSNFDEAKEYELKAAFLYNFSKYINWIPSTMEDNFYIGVVGNSGILKPLQALARTKTVEGKNIVIREYKTPDQVRFCHILFIPKEMWFSLNSVLSKVDRGTLTVSEIEGSTDDGVALNFVIVNNKLKFEANVSAINMSGLKASSDLLKLAIIY